MAFFDKIRLAILAFKGEPDLPRWLRERDEARDEVDKYRRAAELAVGEFVGSNATAQRIQDRIRELEGEVRNLRRSDHRGKR